MIRCRSPAARAPPARSRADPRSQGASTTGLTGRSRWSRATRGSPRILRSHGRTAEPDRDALEPGGPGPWTLDVHGALHRVRTRGKDVRRKRLPPLGEDVDELR